MIDFSNSNTSYIDSVPGWVDNHRSLKASLHLASVSGKRNAQECEFSPKNSRDIHTALQHNLRFLQLPCPS